MGGAIPYVPTIKNIDRISSFYAHNKRDEPSREPGTDLYCPIGTPLYAPWDGVVHSVYDGIDGAYGRFVRLNLTTGLGFRSLHMLERRVKPGDRIEGAQLIGISGATGYGKPDWSADPSTGGAHVHVTFSSTIDMRFGQSPYNNMIDPMLLFDLDYWKPKKKDDDDMSKVINIVKKNGDRADTGVLYIARASGGYERLPQTPNDRGIWSKRYYGGDGTQDLIPTFSQFDFETTLDPGSYKGAK